MHIPNNVEKVLEKLHNAGFEAYIVGGCVRDMLLDIEPHDWDITTSAEPLEVKGLFERTIDTGIEHGTVMVMMDKEGYEVTTYRLDGEYTDHRRPDSVDFTKSLTEDLKRRDFTINAMAYNKEDGVVDLFDGQKDLEKGIIRCVGVAKERFTEDALRMLRAIRFAARFGFVIDLETEDAVKSLANLIESVSAERIHMELTKTLCAKHPETIELLATYGLMEYVMPEFKPNVGLVQNHPYHIYPVDQHTYECLKNIEAEEGLRWAIYLHDIGKGYTKTTDDQGIDHFYGHPKISVELSDTILSRLKFDNKTRKRILQLIETHDYRFKANLKSVRKAMAKMGTELFPQYIAVQRADVLGQNPDKGPERIEDLKTKETLFKEVLDLNQCVTIKDLAVSGKTIIGMGVSKGELIGEVLNHLLTYVLEVPENNETSLLIREANRYLKSRGFNETN